MDCNAFQTQIIQYQYFPNHYVFTRQVLNLEIHYNKKKSIDAEYRMNVLFLSPQKTME